jgi:hypothetical protein
MCPSIREASFPIILNRSAALNANGTQSTISELLLEITLKHNPAYSEVLWNVKFHYSVHKNLPLVDTLIEMISVRTIMV